MAQTSGMGATHLAIALANYTARWLKAQTALIEFGEKNTLAQLSNEQGEESFCKRGVTYYPAVTSYELGYIYNMNYEYMILDLGADSRKAREELMRCDGKLIIGSLKPWRKANFYNYINNIQKNMGNLEMITFLALFEDKIEIKKCRRTFKVQVKSVPFIADPFCVKEKEVAFLHSLV